MIEVSRILAIFFIFSLNGCFSSNQAKNLGVTDFLGDFKIQEETLEHSAFLSVWKNGVNWERYNKILLLPVKVSDSAGSIFSKMRHADISEYKELLEFCFRDSLKRHFLFVSKTYKEALIVQLIITDQKAADLLLNDFSKQLSAVSVFDRLKQLQAQGVGIGNSSVQINLLDSTTGELLMTFVDQRYDSFKLSDSYDDPNTIKYAYTQLSEQFKLQIGRKMGN